MLWDRMSLESWRSWLRWPCAGRGTMTTTTCACFVRSFMPWLGGSCWLAIGWKMFEMAVGIYFMFFV